MMASLLNSGEALARTRQQQLLKRVADQLKSRFGDGAVAVEEASVIVSGRGLVKRWLIDPSLRFLAGRMQ